MISAMILYIFNSENKTAGLFNCPEPDGTFQDTRQCDKYYECFNGIAEERLCPDGLVFDPSSNKREPCGHIYFVNIGDCWELRKYLS